MYRTLIVDDEKPVRIAISKHYFSKAFRTYYGISPIAFRQERNI